jgi:hypothetical protein
MGNSDHFILHPFNSFLQEIWKWGEQDRQCTYIVTLRRVRATIVAVEKQVLHNLSVCICSLRYPACKCAWPVQLSVACPALQCFSALSHKRHDFRKKILLRTQCVFRFSLQPFVWNISHCKRKWARYAKECILVFVWSTLYWSLCEVPFIGLRVKYPLLVFVWSTLYWSLCEVPFIGLRVKYPLLVFVWSTVWSTLYWPPCEVPCEVPLIFFRF